MRDPPDYHEQAVHARRLADITFQRNVEEILRRVAEELNRLADKITADGADFCNPERLERL